MRRRLAQWALTTYTWSTPGTGAGVSEGRLTHLDDSGAARMVDVSGKDVTVRTATATGRVVVSAEVLRLLRAGSVPKGDALGVARIAGIQAAKRTPDLVPLCHPVAIHAVEVDVTVAQRLSDEQLATVRERVSTAIGRNAVVHQYVDESIIGGLVLRVQDKLIDASVKHQLETIRRQMLQAAAKVR